MQFLVHSVARVWKDFAFQGIVLLTNLYNLMYLIQNNSKCMKYMWIAWH